MRTPAVVGSLLMLLVLGCGGGRGGFGALIPPVEENVARSLIGTPFCCDPDQPFPQDIAVLRVRNDYPNWGVVVVIGPFSNGVVTEDGLLTQKFLGPGDVLDTKLQATRCDFETAEGNLVIARASGPDSEAFAAGSLTQLVVLENTCPSGLVTRIPAGLEVSGLARAYFDKQNDPAPIGTDPVLYVVGASNTAAVETYAIRTDATTGRITSAPKVDFTLVGVPGAGDDDIVPVSAGAGPLPGAGSLTRALYLFNPLSRRRTHWNLTSFGGLLVNSGVKDMVSYGGNSRSSGVSFVRGGSAGFEEYDPAVNFFNGVPAPGHVLGGETNFPNHVGDPASAFVDEASRGAVIVMDGSPGQVWFHDRQDPLAEGVLAGVAGNDPRQVRAKNGLVAISNYGSGTVTMMAWAGPIKPIPTGTLTFAGTPIANPLKMDMLDIDQGRTLLAVASDTTDSWWLGELDGSGNVLRSFSGNYGTTGGLADIVFLPGKTTYLAIAAKGLREVLLVPTEFESAPQ